MARGCCNKAIWTKLFIVFTYFLFILYLSSNANIKFEYLQEELKENEISYNKNRYWTDPKNPRPKKGKKRKTIKPNGWVHTKNQL